MHDVFIGIGSNLGDRQKHCDDAIALMEASGIHLARRSPMRETEPWGVTDQPRFINMVVRVGTNLTPYQLLGTLKGIERDMGRERTEKWGPRIIDLDILLFDDLSIDEEDLTIPHPHMFERDFVLEPMKEIAPGVLGRYTS